MEQSLKSKGFRSCPEIESGAVLKSTSSAWSSGCSCSRSPRQEAVNCQPVHNKGDRDLRHSRSQDPPLNCKDIKAQGFLCLGSPCRGTRLSCYFDSYCTKIKLYQRSGCKDTATGKPGLSC